MSEQGGAQVLPFYIVCDESSSMTGDPIEAVNKGLIKLHQAVASDPVVADKARIGVLAFSDQADVLLHCTRLDHVTQMPGCTVKGSTSYRAAFQGTKELIDQDVATLKAEGNQVLRPVVFFISDGAPNGNENWQADHATLVDSSNPFHPHILSFGVGGADADVILEVATSIGRLGGKKFAYLASNGVDPGNALREIIGRLTASIISSANSTSPQLVPPTDIPGVITLDSV